jgi:Hemerythrin HHE cation binding domain
MSKSDELNLLGAAVAAQFSQFLDLQTAMCRELENIADSLPRLADHHACLTLAQRMLPLIKRAHQFEEAQVWPILSRSSPPTLDLRETLDRLSYEHWGDEDFAEQIFHLLRDYVHSPQIEKADSLAWTLRGFFQNLQRHIAFERDFLLPLMAAGYR